MTFWPRFAISRNDIGNLAEVKDIMALPIDIFSVNLSHRRENVGHRIAAT